MDPFTIFVICLHSPTFGTSDSMMYLLYFGPPSVIYNCCFPSFAFGSVVFPHNHTLVLVLSLANVGFVTGCHAISLIGRSDLHSANPVTFDEHIQMFVFEFSIELMGLLLAELAGGQSWALRPWPAGPPAARPAAATERLHHQCGGPRHPPPSQVWLAATGTHLIWPPHGEREMGGGGAGL